MEEELGGNILGLFCCVVLRTAFTMEIKFEPKEFIRYAGLIS